MIADDRARTMLDLANVYRDHRAYVRACLVSCRVPASTLDDAIQDVFVVLFRRADRYDGTRGTLRAWLFGICLRVARQHRRKAGRPALTASMLGADDAVDDPERYASRLQATALARQILDTLPREQLSVLVLADIEGLTGPEIANSLQLELGTVHSRLSRARRRLASEVTRRRRDEGVEARPWFAVLAVHARDLVRTRPQLATAAFVSVRTIVLLVGLAAIATALWWLRANPAVAEQDTATASTDPAAHASASPGPRVDPVVSAAEALSIRSSSVAGTIRDEDGNPVGGATGCAWLEAQNLIAIQTQTPRCSVADRTGRYEIRNLMPARYRVTASAPNLQPGQHDTGSRLAFFSLGRDEQRSDVDVVLLRGGAMLRGIVSDVTGGPVSGAVVMARDTAMGDPLADGAWGPTPPALAKTNDEGEFAIWVAPGDAKLTAIADGYAQAEARTVAPGLLASLVMTPESILAGRVVDATSGAPIAGASVRVGGRGPDRLGALTAFSDDAGAFRITGLAPGRYRPRASAAGRVGDSDASIAVGLGETIEDLTVKMHAVASVSGKIIGPDDAGCAGGIAAMNSETGETLATMASPSGAVLFEAVPPGVYDVMVACHGLSQDGPPPRLTVADTDVTDQRWRLTRGATIRGTVTHADGRAAAGVSVSGYSTSAGASQVPLAARTAADGSYSLPGVAGSYVLSASGRGTAEATVREVAVAGDDVSVDIELPLSRALEGTVVDDGDRPQAGVTVILHAPRRQTMTRDDGSFRFDGVTIGTHEVSAQRSITDERRATTATVTAEADARVELRLPALSKVITGTVTDDGGPVADAIVTALPDAELARRGQGPGMQQLRHLAGFGRSRAPVLTDAHGRFEIDVSDNGPFTVMAQRRGGGDAWRSGVNTDADVTLAVPALASLAGTITTTEGAAVSRLRIRLRETTSGAVINEPFFFGDGDFRFEGLSAGTYELVAVANEGRIRTELALGAGEERTNLSLALVGTVSVRGTVVDITSGKPVEGMLVFLGAEDEEIDQFATWAERAVVFGKAEHRTDAEGRFTLSKVPPGAVRAMVMSAKLGQGQYGMAMFAMTVAGTAPMNEVDPIYIAPMPGAADGTKAAPAGLVVDQPGPWCVDTPKLTGVAPGSPAARAGLTAGDELTAVAGHDVTGRNCHLVQRLTMLTPGASIAVTLADGRSVTLTP